MDIKFEIRPLTIKMEARIIKGSLSGKCTRAGRPIGWRLESDTNQCNSYKIIGPIAEFSISGKNMHIVGDLLIDIIDAYYVRVYQIELPLPRPIFTGACERIYPDTHSTLIYHDRDRGVVYHLNQGKVYVHVPKLDFSSLQLCDGRIIGCSPRYSTVVDELGDRVGDSPIYRPDYFYVKGKYIVCSYKDKFIIYDSNWKILLSRQCTRNFIFKEMQNIVISVVNDEGEPISKILISDHIYEFDTTKLDDPSNDVFMNGYVDPGIKITYDE